LKEWTDPKNKAEHNAMGFYNVSVPGGLSGYQRRLVYQLVRTEFTQYRAFLPRKNADFVQVEKMDTAKEAKVCELKIYPERIVIDLPRFLLQRSSPMKHSSPNKLVSRPYFCSLR
jgi:hypothetical protein